MDVAALCVRVGLADHDVVYAPLLSSYGSIPATLQATPQLPPPQQPASPPSHSRIESVRLGRGVSPSSRRASRALTLVSYRLARGSGARGRCAGCGSRC
jgi:hypothetical protein